ncbi:MAG: PepSY-associated TM helix domain-containing protein [Gammaproteobacteria bacterium]|jgi:hypothetical protein|nr:PepSY-associated TM helix domain-containing protein [Gammaproteobacteria bacterium]
MKESTHVSPSVASARDWLARIHGLAGLVSIPFLLVSILLAVALTHTQLVNALSEMIYPSLPIPVIELGEPVEPGSWDQARRIARLVAGSDGQVITMRDENIAVVQAFVRHSHDPEVMATNPRLQVLIDLRDMRILRIQDRTTSLVTQAHMIHAFRFFGIHALSVSTISSVLLVVLLASGAMLARLDRRAGRAYEGVAAWHVRLGRLIGLFVVIIVLTTLHLEFGLFGRGDRAASLPLPDVGLEGPVRPGSIDQARRLAGMAIGTLPRAAFIRGDGADVKFSEAGDGIGGKSVWMNANTMTVERMTDWRNDRQALNFIIHDGRWLGGMNALNINDIGALILLLVVISGGVLNAGRWRRRGSAANRRDA